MKYLSVCSGIEAATCAFHPLGWEPVAFSEIEPFPAAVLAHHYPNVPNLGDMTQFQNWPDYAISLLVGGTPCQSFSVAGLRKGLADPRGNLMLTYLAIAARYRPKWLVWENVPGVLSSNGGKDFGALLGGLAELGYGFAYRVLDAQYVRVESHARAVPQRRRRVFVVGCLGDWRRAAAVLFERESLRGDSPPRRISGKSVAPTLASRARGGGGLGTDFDCDGGLIARDVAHAVACHAAKGGDPTTDNYVAHALRGEGFDASEDGTGRGTPLVPIAFQHKASAQQSMNPGEISPTLDIGKSDGVAVCIAFSCGTDAGEVSPTLRSMGHDGSHANGGGQVAIAIQAGATRENPASGPDGVGVRTDGASYTIEARSEVQAVCSVAIRGRGDGRNLETRDDGTANAILTPNGGRDGMGVGAIATTHAVRRLTVRECSRLQGFPDDYLQIPWDGWRAMDASETPESCAEQGLETRQTKKGKWRVKDVDGPKYRSLGNSMAVNCMSWIGQRIAQVEAITEKAPTLADRR